MFSKKKKQQLDYLNVPRRRAGAGTWLQVVLALVVVGVVLYFLYQDLQGRSKGEAPARPAEMVAPPPEPEVEFDPPTRPAIIQGKECLSEQGNIGAHRFLANCREEFQQALEEEVYLVKTADPARSRRARKYCELITQGVQNGCMATSATFCLLQICQELAAGN